MKFAVLLFSACLLTSLTFAEETAPAANAVTVPITLDHNRVVIDVRLPMPDGSSKRVRAWVDNGNPDMWITAALADKLKLPLSGEPQPILDGQARIAQPPASFTIGSLVVKPGKVRVYAVMDRESIAPGMSAEVSVPSTVLRNYDVVVDYTNREFTIGEPGAVHFKGTKSKAQINSENGLIQIASMLGREQHNLALDFGASFSFIAAESVSKLRHQNPGWPHMTGAVGPANLWGVPDEATTELIRIPSLQYGGVTLNDVGMASFPEKEMDWFEKRAGMESIGLVGANALLNYRLGIDYAHSTVYFDQTGKTRPPEMDVVGLTLRPEPDENYTVIGIPTYDGKPAVAEVQPNDLLVSVDQTPVKGGTMGQVWSLLSGSPGDERELEIKRGEKKFTVKATVRRFLAAR